MPPVAILSPEESAKILLRWEKEGPTDEERVEFMNTALEQLADDDEIKAFAKNISQVADMAAGINKVFLIVQDKLTAVTRVIGQPVAHLLRQWVIFEQRYRACLYTSFDLSTTISDVLKRFDEVYLAKVENIQTDQDRVAAIQAMESFIDELTNKDQSAELSRQFLELKRDVLAFVNEFNTSALSVVLNALLQALDALDKQIKSAQVAVGVAAGGIVFGLGVKASGVIASLNAQRQVEGMQDMHAAMIAINSLVIPQTQGDQIISPDINAMLEKFVIFAEIWSSIRNQSVQFTEHLKGGMGAATNTRFRNEVKLVRATCTPLKEGLLEYKKQLGGWL